MSELKTYQAVLKVEIDVKGDFPSLRAFDAAIEKMWKHDGYWTVARDLGLDIEENLEDTIMIAEPEDDEEDDLDPNTITCLFPDSHDPGHLAGRTFSVLFYGDTEWQDLTEQVIRDIDRGFFHTSDWDFWYEKPFEGEAFAECEACKLDIIKGNGQYLYTPDTDEYFHGECVLT